MEENHEETEVLENPEKLPLHSLYLNKKIIERKSNCPTDKMDLEDIEKFQSLDFSKLYTEKYEKIKAISSAWLLKTREYHEFHPYFYMQCSEEDNNTFIERNSLFLAGIEHLLSCSYRYFWCYILCEPRISKVLSGFLNRAVFHYDLKYMSSSCLETYELICSAVYKIFERMVTFQVSEIEYMPEEIVVEYLHQHHYLSVRNIMALVLLYSSTNVSNFTDSLINYYFTKKRLKEVTKELENILGEIAMEMEIIQEQVSDDYEGILITPDRIRKKPTQFDPGWFEDIVSPILHYASLLNAFFSKNAQFLDIASETGIVQRATMLYEKVYPELFSLIFHKEKTSEELENIKERILDRIVLSQTELITFFNCFVTDLLDKIQSSRDDSKVQSNYVDEYLTFISSVLEYEEFIRDYHEVYNIEQQLQTIFEWCQEIDTTRTSYILDCLSHLTKPEEENEPEESKPGENVLVVPLEILNPQPSTSKEQKNYQEPSEDEISELINIILDACPEVASGFILKCLKRMDYDPVRVIEAIHSDNLPKELNEVSREEVYIPPEQQPKVRQPILAYRGKKPQYRDAVTLLDDKKDFQDIKDFVLKTTYGSYDPYDEEYDDRVESDPPLNFDRTADVDEIDPDLNRNNNYEVVSDPSDTSEEEAQKETKNATGDRDRTRDFCENPEVIRARQEAKRNQNYKRGGGKSGINPRNQDVVGKPKGQGQDKGVQISRDKKNVQKSSRANHNRKGGAQWKRNRGMVPS